MLFTTLTTAFFASTTWASPITSTNLPKRQGGDSLSGWQSIPVPAGAVYHSDWQISGHNFPILFSNDTASSITRAIILPSGKLRNCWGYYDMITSTVNTAVSSSLVTAEEVSIATPCFMAAVDQAAGAVDADSLIWGQVDWDYGGDSVGPEGASISSYTVLDQLVDYYLDSNNFPNLKTVVVAGHSMGGQMIQRYAVMHNDSPSEAQEGKSVHYWIGNPGSLAWFTSDRPHPDSNCPDPDQWKYGLAGSFVPYAANDAAALGREGLVSRVKGRNVHHLWGTADKGVGDDSCQASTQGASRIEIGQNFNATIAASGGTPATWTMAWIKDVSHDDVKMFGSKHGLKYMFTT